MKIISSKIVAAMLVVLMLCMLLPSAALAEGGTVTLKKYDDKGEDGSEKYQTITVEANDSQGIPAGTYCAAPFTSIAIVKQATFAVVFGVSSVEELKTTIGDADSSIYQSKQDRLKIDTSDIHFVSTTVNGNSNIYKCEVPGSNAGTYYFGYEVDGVKYVLAPGADKVSHFVTDVTDSSTTPTPDPTPDPGTDPSTPPEKESKPSMEKTISDSSSGEYEKNNLENAVAPGATVYFKLTSNLPEALETAIEVDESAGTKTMKDEQTLTFTDTMSSNLTRNSDLEVYIGNNKVTNNDTTSYYTVEDGTTTDNGEKTFTVTLDLDALYNAKIITDDDIGIADKVTVTYSATVSANAADEEDFQNKAYATYNETPSVTSIVTGKVETEEPDTPPGHPPTGGAGTTLFTVGGLGLMAVAGALLLRRRQDA